MFSGVLLLKTALLIISSILITGCSLYASQGRKLLEQQAFEIAASFTASNFEYCGTDLESIDWSSWHEDARATVQMSSDGRMRVTPKSDGNVSCYFRFKTPEEMHQKTEAAIEVSLHLSPVECATRFAFRSSCHLK